jgi:phosphatidylglycerophosphate synthase
MFDAIVLAISPHAGESILGLTLVERGRRVAAKAGARRVLVLDEKTVQNLTPWISELGDADLLVLRASDQLVHLPLVKPLLAASGDQRVAVGPDGSSAGALYVTPTHAAAIATALAKSPETIPALDTAVPVPHGSHAVHIATTPAERKAAAQMMLQLLVKADQDSPVSKYIYRPLSRPLTRALLHTPITPNQVSYVTGIVGIAGCVLTAFPSNAMLVLGALLVFISGIIDGCDGEIARMKLQFSPFGAWLDTIIDELTQVTYFFAIGYHTYQHYPHAWVGWSILVGGASFLATIYAIYYFSIVVIRQGGSQYYETDVELIEVDGAPALRKRPKAPPPIIVEYILYLIRRDFINLAALVISFFNGFVVIYGGIWIGTIVAALITIPAHWKLMSLIKRIRAQGAPLRYVHT